MCLSRNNVPVAAVAHCQQFSLEVFSTYEARARWGHGAVWSIRRNRDIVPGKRSDAVSDWKQNSFHHLCTEVEVRLGQAKPDWCAWLDITGNKRITLFLVTRIKWLFEGGSSLRSWPKWVRVTVRYSNHVESKHRILTFTQLPGQRYWLDSVQSDWCNSKLASAELQDVNMPRIREMWMLSHFSYSVVTPRGKKMASRLICRTGMFTDLDLCVSVQNVLSRCLWSSAAPWRFA